MTVNYHDYTMENGPTFREMFLNLSSTAADVYKMLVEQGVVMADKETFHKRIDLCTNCQYITSTMGILRCGACGCGISVKPRLAAAMCPIGKWMMMSGEEIKRLKDAQQKS